MSVSAAATAPSATDIRVWENRFLEWFAGQGIPLVERELQVGGLKYHHFSAAFDLSDGRKTTSHGRSRERRLAVIRCAAESVERRWMVDAYRGIAKPVGDAPPFPPRRILTSNGWAVHRTPELALQGAYEEALQRHLLLKSFLAESWNGFYRVQEIHAPDMTLHLLMSRYRSGGMAAGMVVAKSPLYAGVALGYCAGEEHSIGSPGFWEPAIYEACDKILTLKGTPVNLATEPGSWIVSELKHFLESSFDLGKLECSSQVIVREESPRFEVCRYDVSSAWNLDFPLYASFVFGGDLIPLFHAANLGLDETLYIHGILSRNNIFSELPERHPVL